MVRKIRIDGYKTFRDFEMGFPDGVTLICGPNGSGKSALREALRAVSGFLAMPGRSGQTPASLAFPPCSFCRWQAKSGGRAEMSVGLELAGRGGKVFFYSLDLRCGAGDGSVWAGRETLEASAPGRGRKLLLSGGRSGPSFRSESGSQAEAAHDGKLSCMPLGSEANGEIREFCELAGRILTFSRDFRNPECRSERKPGAHRAGGLSDGQMALCALRAVLDSAPDGSTLVLDNPEAFLAPGEIQPLLFAIDDMSEERGVQTVVISHHPKTLNWYHKDAVIFRVAGSPPRTEAAANPNVAPLYETLSETERHSGGLKPW